MPQLTVRASREFPSTFNTIPLSHIDGVDDPSKYCDYEYQNYRISIMSVFSMLYWSIVNAGTKR